MGKTASRRPLLLRFKWACAAIAAIAGLLSHLRLVTGSARFTPSIRTNVSPSTCTRPGEYKTAPRRPVCMRLRKPRTAIFGFHLTRQGMYRFDGVRFLPWTLSPNGKSIDTIVNVYGDHAGGLWALGEREIVHLKGGVVTSHFNLDGLQQFQQISEDPDGSLWVVRGRIGWLRRAPLPYYGPSRQVFRKV